MTYEQLRAAAEAALTVFDEAISYVGTPTWSPSMESECKAALSQLRATLAEPVKQREPLTDVEILDLFGLYLEARRYDGRQIHAQTGTVGYDECEWTAFQSAVVQTERAHGIEEEHDAKL